MGHNIDRCLPFQIKFNQLYLPQVDSNEVVQKKGWIHGNTMQQSFEQGSEYL